MKTVLIVGASSGIGYACAKKFLSEGYFVLNFSRTDCILAGVKNYLCDITDEEKTKTILQNIVRENPEINYLVYSAGYSVASPLETISDTDYRYLYEVNFFGFVRVLQILLPTLRHSFATVCVVSSVAALCPVPFDSFYASSKAALNAFILGLQAELFPKNVHLISVLPGGTKTNFTYARKIYPPEKVADYGDAFHKSMSNLTRIEQTGYDPSSVASCIFYACIDPNKPFVCCGFQTKLFRLAARILPKKMLLTLLKNKFFSGN